MTVHAKTEETEARDIPTLDQRSIRTGHYRLIIGLLVIATIAVYLQVQGHSFVDADDPLYITNNVHVQRGLTLNALIWACTTGHAANWHPVTWLSHMLDYALYGENPAGHHLTSLLIHVANTILLFLIFARMTRSIWKSAFVAAVFALHPLHVESVAWAAERKDVLSAFFWFLTMGAYALYVGKKGVRRYLLVVLFFTLGLMAKPMLVTLPFVLLLLDYWPFRRFEKQSQTAKRRTPHQKQNTPSSQRAMQLVREKAPLFLLAAISSVVTLVVQEHGGAVPSIGILTLTSRIGNALVSYVKYLGKTVWPSELAVFYPHPMGATPLWQPIGAALLLLAICMVTIRWRKTHPYLPVGWFWFLGTLVPVIGIVQVGEQSMADRYMYVPLIGLSVIVAWGMDYILARWRYRRIALAASGTAALLVLMALSWSQVGCWRDTVTLFERANQVTSNNYVALTGLGAALQERGKTDAAMGYYKQALHINGSYELAHYNLAVVLQTQGDTLAALSHFTLASRLNPNNSSTHYALGLALFEKGDIQSSLFHYLRAAELDPDSWQAHYGAGLAYGRAGSFDSAVVHFAEALRINPANPDAHLNLGLALHKNGNLQAAIVQYSEAIRLKPDNALAHGNLAAALHKLGRIDEAILHYSEALRLKPDFMEARSNLQLALASQHERKTP